MKTWSTNTRVSPQEIYDNQPNLFVAGFNGVTCDNFIPNQSRRTKWRPMWKTGHQHNRRLAIPKPESLKNLMLTKTIIGLRPEISTETSATQKKGQPFVTTYDVGSRKWNWNNGRRTTMILSACEQMQKSNCRSKPLMYPSWSRFISSRWMFWHIQKRLSW